MQKLLVIVTVFLAAMTVGLFLGCDDSPSNPGVVLQDDPASIELRLSAHRIIGSIGEERTIIITAIARNSDQVALSNVDIRFAIENQGMGTITAGSDTAGAGSSTHKIVTYTVVLQESADVTIIATAGNVRNQVTIEVLIDDDIVAEIRVVAVEILTVPPNESVSTPIRATAIDSFGIGISGIEVRFWTDPSDEGYIDGEIGVTDTKGEVTKTFTTLVSEGSCNVFARVGSHIDSTTISIMPRAQPAKIILFTSTPHITVIPNENAEIQIRADVTDAVGTGVPRATVNFEVLPVSGEDIFGSMTPSDTTDNNGRILSTFSTLGGSGKLYIKATVLPSGDIGISMPEGDEPEAKLGFGKNSKGKSISSTDDEEISDQIEIEVEMLTSGIGNITLRVNPPFLNLAPDSTGIAKVTASITDMNRNAIPNMIVDFDCQDGEISKPTPTDSSGEATAEYRICPQAHFDEGVSEIDDPITATIRNTAFTNEVIITVRKSAEDFGNLELISDKDSIYADNGLTKAKLWATVKDANNVHLPYLDIEFRSNYGIVSPTNPPHDSMGVATAYFIGRLPSINPETGVHEPAIVEAVYAQMSISDSWDIWINPRQKVQTITLTVMPTTLSAGSGDSAWVRAICQLEDGRSAPAGTEVHFEVDNGSFSEPIVPITGVYGMASTWYIAGQTVGIAHIRAFVINSIDDIKYSLVHEVTLRAGPPFSVGVTAYPEVLRANDPTSFSTVTATVRDSVGNPIDRPVLVSFVATLGALNRLAASTGDSGTAIVLLYPGVSAGVAEITASVNTPAGGIEGQTTVSITSSGPNTIQLNADTSAISPQGTGGLTSTTLFATLLDANGNLVESPYWVHFDLLNEDQYSPIDRCNINQHGLSDSAQTSGGIARVTLNSGTVSGPKLVRAYTWRDPGERIDTVSVTLSRVQVISGPPDAVDIDVNNEGEDAGGATWAIEVSARVSDIHKNPVEEGIPVQFSCEPDIAMIGESRTGNESRSGETEKGVAFAVMTYNSDDTYGEVTIYAVIETEGATIEGECERVLPLQEPVLLLHVTPHHWMIDYFPDANIMCMAELEDGHQVLINNAPILFASNRAYFFWYNYVRRDYIAYDMLARPPEPVIKYTGWHIDWGQDYVEHREAPGQATVYLQGEEYDFFLEGMTLEINVNIEAEVVGHEDGIADPVVIVITRH